MPEPPPSPRPRPPVVIAGDRGKALLLLFMSLGFVACGWFLVGVVATWATVVVGWASIAFFGACAAASLVDLARPPRLSVDQEGVAWRGLRSWRLAWEEIASLRLQSAERSTSVLVERRAAPGGPRLRPRTIPPRLQVPPEGILSLLRERLPAAGALPAAEEAPPSLPSPPLPRRAVPWASLALVAVLAAVFAAECGFPVAPERGSLDPAVATLSAFGGSSRALTVGEGQWFRVLLAPLLHGNLVHLLGNAVALLWAGWTLEGLLGRAWFLAVYAAGGLAGEAASLIVNPPDLVDVGASGAIMALFAATLALSLRYRGTALQSRLQGRAVYMLGPALFPATRGTGEVTINVAAHVGGAVAGALVGVALLRAWAPAAERPPGRRLASAAAGLCLAATLAAAWPAAGRHAIASSLAEAVRPFQAGDLDRARSAVDAVLRRAPGEADAWNLAGAITFVGGDAQAAQANFDAAYRLAPSAGVLGVRGLAALYAGDLAGAEADLARAVALDRGDLYPALWLAIARGRDGGAPALSAADLAEARPGWPLPVARMFAGLESPGALRAEAARLGPNDVCEADLYIAEQDRARGAEAAARDGFGQAVRECPPSFTEAGMARLELARVLPTGEAARPRGR